jgi:hypothetical protein
MKNKWFRIMCLWMFCHLTFTVSAQKDPYEGLMEAIWLDSMTITAKKMGFDVNNFIDMVREDTSFYQAFKNLRLISHEASHNQEFFNEKGKTIDFYSAKTQLIPAGNCKEIKYISKDKSKSYIKKNGERTYLTAKLYERVFLPSGKICANTTTESTNSKTEGIKTALFSEKMRKYYKYGIESKNYSDGTPCYVFTIKVKDEYSEKKSGRTVVKFMETYFSRKDFQVMGREYEVEYPGPFFSFNIKVNVNLDYLGNKQYLPQIVSYSGEWDIPGRKKEIGKFKMQVTSTKGTK